MEIADKLSKEIETKLEQMLNEGFNNENIDKMYKLVDIHKDIENEKYWKEKIMRYRESYNEGSYGRRGVPGTGRGRYRDGEYSAGGNYGRRGVDSKYRGEDIMDDMYQAYQEYSDGKEMYGADNKTMESFKYMIKSFKDYYKHLKETASSQEETQILDQAIDEMARM